MNSVKNKGDGEVKAPDAHSHTPPRAEGWQDVLQLLKEQNERMEKLARALSVIQQGMLRNNPGLVKDSVNEATEVLSGMLNTQKCLLESGVRIQKRNRIPPRHEEIGDLSETTGVSGRYPKKSGDGAKEIPPPLEKTPQREKVGSFPSYAQVATSQPPNK